MRRSYSVVWAFALLLTATVAVAARAPTFSKAIAKRVVAAAETTGNQKPLIGILTQPCHYCPGKSYVAAGYVKLIEMAGGRAVPVRFYASEEELYRLFKSINGLIFPGGLTWLWLDSPYVLAARKLWNWAREENDKGNPFPIHGTCLGHQLLHILESNVSRNYLLVDTDSVAHPTTLEFTGDSLQPSAHLKIGRLP
jgi:gamma-glutamyl hydrolase